MDRKGQHRKIMKRLIKDAVKQEAKGHDRKGDKLPDLQLKKK